MSDTEKPAIDPTEQKRLDTVHNERTKLTATWLNNLGVGAIVAGVIAPSISAIGNGDEAVIPLVSTGLAWILVGIALHMLGRKILGRMRP